MFLHPDSKACAEKYGEGPDAKEEEKTISQIIEEVSEDICDNTANTGTRQTKTIFAKESETEKTVRWTDCIKEGSNMDYPEIYAVDFDKTINLADTYPELGKPNMELIEFLKERRAAGDKIILWTCREGESLKRAVKYCNDYGLTFDAVNDNIRENIEYYGNNCRKVWAHHYIDDRNYKNISGSAGRIERLTQWIDKETAIPRVDLKRCGHERCTTQLARYEDTGLTPDDVQELKERNTPKEVMYEGDGYSEGEMVYDTWICPNCGVKYEVDYDDYDFCPECGQAVLR